MKRTIRAIELGGEGWKEETDVVGEASWVTGSEW